MTAPVRLEATRLVLARPLSTSCAMALAWVTFEHEANRLARRHLDSDLVGIEHYGSYACRGMSSNSRRMSLHASARAIDLSGFVLADGRRVSVRDDWGDWNDKGRFLKAVAHAACEHFNLVLTPAHDRAHHDHFHLDIGPWRLCGT